MMKPHSPFDIYILLDAKHDIKYKIHWCHWWDNWNAEKVENIRSIRMPNGIKSIDIVFQTGKRNEATNCST